MITEREQNYARWTQIFENLSDDQFEIANYTISAINDFRKREKNTRLMKEHDQTLTGKTYRRVFVQEEKEIVEYYKIISGFASSSVCVTCLFFSEPLECCLSYHNYYGGKEVKVKGLFKVVDYLIDNFSSPRYGFEEISKEEWEAAFDNFCKQLKELKWEKKL